MIRGHFIEIICFPFIVESHTEHSNYNFSKPEQQVDVSHTVNEEDHERVDFTVTAGRKAPGGWYSPSEWSRESTTESTASSTSTVQKPYFVLRLNDVCVHLGENVHLKCIVVGHPVPVIEWRRNGQLLNMFR